MVKLENGRLLQLGDPLHWGRGGSFGDGARCHCCLHRPLGRGGDHFFQHFVGKSTVSDASDEYICQVLVDREVVKEVGRGDEQEIVFFSRHRGLFRVCFPGTEQGEFEERSQNDDFKNDTLEQFL